jgi:hypothetical protein
LRVQTGIAATFWLSHESTNRKQGLVRSLPARPASKFDPSAGEWPEQSRRAAITRSESSHGPCRGLAQSHATTLPPSNDAKCPSSAPQKAHIVFLISLTPPPKTNISIRWCCIDRLSSHDFAGSSRDHFRIAFGHVRRNQYFKGWWGNRDQECADNYPNVTTKSVSERVVFDPSLFCRLPNV